MTWSPPFRVLTDGNGHYLGVVVCSCTPQQWEATDFKADCPVHGEYVVPRDPFIKRLRSHQNHHEDPQVADARGIDVEQATQEQLGL